MPFPEKPTKRSLELVQLPAEMVAVPLLPALNPKQPSKLLTYPPLIVKVPFPPRPTMRSLKLVQLPADTAALLVLPELLPMDALVLTRLPPFKARDPLLKLPIVSEFAPPLPIKRVPFNRDRPKSTAVMPAVL